MDYTVERMSKLTLIGFETEIPTDKGYELCPKFWDDFREVYLSKLNDGSEISRAITDNGIGEFGVCMDDSSSDTFKYMIAGRYMGGKVPEGMRLIYFDAMTWAKFSCIGPMPTALQELNTRLWNEWVPNCKDYTLLGNTNIEWYAEGDTSAVDYQAAIWLPVQRKR